MPPKENSEMSCGECIHYFACSMQCGEQMAQRSATGCECYETVKSIAAARLIERLTAENAKAEAERDALREKVPQWVSVKDRLPDCAVPVLVTYIGYDGNRHGDDVATRIDDWWLWWDGDLRSSDERVTVKITHWMPLPEAPEEGEKEDA